MGKKEVKSRSDWSGGEKDVVGLKYILLLENLGNF